MILHDSDLNSKHDALIAMPYLVLSPTIREKFLNQNIDELLNRLLQDNFDTVSPEI